MSQTLVLLWLAGAQALPEFRADLDSFAKAYLVELAPPPARSQSPIPAYAPDVVSQIEARLDESRREALSLNEPRARELLKEAYELLRNHPELPQSAWLMAEHWHVAADIEESTKAGSELAQRYRAQAASLEGSRENTFDAVTQPIAALAETTLALRGLSARDEFEWDGLRRGPKLIARVGEHHVRVLRNERVLWAGWLNVAENAREVALPVPALVPCSVDDLAGTAAPGNRVVAPSSTLCEAWAVARPNPSGGVQISMCKRDACGKFRIWRRRPEHAAGARPPQSTEENGFRVPLWATYTLIGVGVVAATGIVLWQTGAFDSEPARHEAVWTYRGFQPLIRF